MSINTVSLIRELILSIEKDEQFKQKNQNMDVFTHPLVEQLKQHAEKEFLMYPHVVVVAMKLYWPTSKLNAVKHIKYETNMGLKEAKDLVDQYW